MNKQVVLITLLVAMLMIGCAPAAAGAPQDAEPTPTDEPTAEPTEVVEDTHTLDEPFSLAYGETANLDGGGLSLSFDEVLEDSRCPADAMCVWQGQVSVLLTVNGEEVILTMPSPDSETASDTVGEYTITLTDVQPYPLASDPAEHAEYVVTISVT